MGGMGCVGGEKEKRAKIKKKIKMRFYFLHRKADQQYSETQRLWSKTVM